MRLPTNRPPVHPGEILIEEFMNPYGISQAELARRIGISQTEILSIVTGKKGITADMALRLARLFSTSPELWLNGQIAWDIWEAMRGKNAGEIEAIEPVQA